MQRERRLARVADLRSTFQKDQRVEFAWRGKQWRGRILHLGSKSASIWVDAGPGHSAGSVRIPYANLRPLG
jgi:hypothetical protein